MYREERDSFILTAKLYNSAKEDFNSLIGEVPIKVTNLGMAEMLLFHSSFTFLYLKLINPGTLDLIIDEYRKYLDDEMKHLGLRPEASSYQKIIDKKINRYTSTIKAFRSFPLDCSGSLFYSFFVKPFDNYHSESSHTNLIYDFHNSLRKLIANLKNGIDNVINLDYKYSRFLKGEDAQILDNINKITSTANCLKDYLNSPAKVFALCQQAKKNFPINYLEEFGNRTYEDPDGLVQSYFGDKYPECRSFTSLIYCCSLAIYYLKTVAGKTEYDNPEDDKFFKEFIKLILAEARMIDTEDMEMSLSTCFDDGFYYEEEIVLDYLFKVMLNIMHKHGDDYELEKLAYNYYEIPGTLRFSNNYKSMLDEREKCQELNILIDKAKGFILDNVFYCNSP